MDEIIRDIRGRVRSRVADALAGRPGMDTYGPEVAPGVPGPPGLAVVFLPPKLIPVVCEAIDRVMGGHGDVTADVVNDPQRN